jgi:hypothetical protein
MIPKTVASSAQQIDLQRYSKRSHGIYIHVSHVQAVWPRLYRGAETASIGLQVLGRAMVTNLSNLFPDANQQCELQPWAAVPTK